MHRRGDKYRVLTIILLTMTLIFTEYFPSKNKAGHSRNIYHYAKDIGYEYLEEFIEAKSKWFLFLNDFDTTIQWP